MSRKDKESILHPRRVFLIAEVSNGERVVLAKVIPFGKLETPVYSEVSKLTSEGVKGTYAWTSKIAHETISWDNSEAERST